MTAPTWTTPDRRVQLFVGDAIEQLDLLPDGSVQMCVTSPPYWGLRDYGIPPRRWGDGSECAYGLEPNPDLFVEHSVDIFRAVRRVLRDDGTLWLNFGDSYAQDTKWGGSTGGKHAKGLHGTTGIGRNRSTTGLKPGDLCNIPHRVAAALQADGWFWRSTIIWALGTTNGRPKKLGLCDGNETRNPRSVWTLSAEPYKAAHFATYPTEIPRRAILAGTSAVGCCPDCGQCHAPVVESERIPTRPGTNHKIKLLGDNPHGEHGVIANLDPERHIAVTRTIGHRPTCRCSAGGPVPCVVLDPFGGSGTTGQVANALGRQAVLIEVNPTYADLIKSRVTKPLRTNKTPRSRRQPIAAKDSQLELFPTEGTPHAANPIAAEET